MLPRRARSLIAALFLSASALGAQGTAPSTAATTSAALATSATGQGPTTVASSPAIIAAPARLRQGDPLLAWIVTEAPNAEAPAATATAATATAATGLVLEARLLNPAGKVVAKARCFAASFLLSHGEASLAAEGLLDAAPAPEVTVQPRRILYGVLLPLPIELPPGAYRLVAANANANDSAGALGSVQSLAVARIDVDARDFPLETIKLNEANSNLRTVPTERKAEEARKLYAILTKVDDSAVYAEPSTLVFPVAGGWKSSGFGDRRRYVYSDGTSERSVHEGIDWAVVAGTPVLACAKGKVVLAADREVTGKTLIIEHLPGLYSLYFHLSSIEVAEGAIVERGARIARSGSTGMATGPHLHWELRAKGEAVDPEYWLGPPLLDKAGLTAIMNGLIEGR